MNMNDYLNDETYFIYAAKAYDNPQCESKEEFEDDLKRVHYVKKLLNKYVSTGELKTRLILNHITLLHNVFGIKPTANMLFFKLDPILYTPSKDFPSYLSAIVVAPADIENAIQRQDPLLKEIVSEQPEVIFINRKGEELWERMRNAS